MVGVGRSEGGGGGVERKEEQTGAFRGRGRDVKGEGEGGVTERGR